MNSEKLVDEALRGVSSFSERLGKEEYFTGAGHLNILVSLRRDIAARVPLLVLTGGEGCGKSVLSRMAASEVRSGCLPVYLEGGIDSFDGLINTVAERLDIELTDLTRDSVAENMDRIAAALAGRSQRLLLICDGAERIYLATLERLRKMMDRLNRVVVSLQVVLIGRPLLLDNLRQLSICNFEEIEERRYVLEPLTQVETRSYLEFCRKKLSEDERAIFTPETIERLYRESGGNFKDIHHRAEQLCNRYNKDASFWVLLENVEGGPVGTALAKFRSWQRLGSLLRFDPRQLSRRQQLAAFFAAAGALAALLLVVWPGRQPAEPPAELENQAILQQPVPQESEAVAVERTEEPVAALPPYPQSQQPPRVFSPDANGSAGGEQSIGMETTTPSVEEGAVPAEQTASVVEAEQEINPTRQQLLQAEALLSEAQEAVETARRDEGPGLVGGQETGKIVVRNGSAGADSELAPVHTTGVKIQPVKVVDKASLSVEQIVGTVPVLRQERGKRVTATERAGGEPAVFRAVVGDEPLNGSVPGEASVPVIRSGRGKLKPQTGHEAGKIAGGAPGAEAGSWPAARSRGLAGAAEPVRRLQSSLVEKRPVIEPLEAEAKKIPYLGKAIVPERN